MKIRSRINYTFTILFGAIIIALSIIVFVLSKNSLDDLFEKRLEERLSISENFFFKKQEVTAEFEEKVRRNFLNQLPNEIEYFDDLASFSKNISDSLRRYVPDNLELLINEKGIHHWKKNDFFGIAKLHKEENKSFVLMVLAQDTFGEITLNKLAIILLASSFSAILLTFVLSYYFSKNVLKPIAHKIKKANNISAKNLEERLMVYNENDELGMLAQSFNALLDRLENSFELQKNFIRYASHELKNPLAIIIGDAEVALMSDRTTENYKVVLERIKNKAIHINILVEHFLELSRIDNLKIQKDSLVLDEILIEVFQNLKEEDQKRLNFNIDDQIQPEMLMVQGDFNLLHNAFRNLIENALKFSDSSGLVSIEIGYNNSIKKTELKIIDEGIGISPELLNKIYDPLFRAENTSGIQGSGIGLSLVKRILELHSFNISVKSIPQIGTTFTLQF